MKADAELLDPKLCQESGVATAEGGASGAGPLEVIGAMTEQIEGYDRQIEEACREKYPETELLRQVGGVGAVTSLAYVLTLEDPHRFVRSRSVGSFLGLLPGQDKSGEQDAELRITKGNSTASLRATATIARFLAFLRPQLQPPRRSQSGPKGPRMYWALPTSGRRNS